MAFLAGERRAITAAVLGIFFIGYVMGFWMGFETADAILIALAAGYGLAFTATVAGYKLAKPLTFLVLAVGIVRGVLGMLPEGPDNEFDIALLAGQGVALLGMIGAPRIEYQPLIGERRVIAALVLAFYAAAYGAMSYLLGEPMGKALAGLAGCYGLAFFAIVAGYFWARWFAVGTLLFGLIQGAVALWQLGPDTIVLFIGGTHLLATLALWGGTMALPYDGQPEWRAKFHMDDNAVQRLGRSIIRAGVSLPMVLLYALMPKPGTGTVESIASLAAVALAAGGLVGLVRLRAWSVLALAGAAVIELASAGDLAVHNEMPLTPLLAGLFLIGSVAPYVTAATRRLLDIR